MVFDKTVLACDSRNYDDNKLGSAEFILLHLHKATISLSYETVIKM